MLNVKRFIDQRFVFKNSGILCLALLFNLSNLRNTILLSKSCCRLRNTSSYIPFFFCILIWIHGWVVKESQSESGGSCSIPDGCWNLLQPLSHFAWHWASQCADTQPLYIAALSLCFFFLDFVSGYPAWTGFQLWTWTSNFHCFGALATWWLRVWPWARTWLHVLACRSAAWAWL